MKTIMVFIALFFTWLTASSQNIVLSNLSVKDVFTPSTGEITNLMIDFNVTSPESLAQVEVKMESISNPTDFHLTVVPIVLKDGKAFLEFEKFTQPLEGNKIEIMQPVRNQLTQPYDRISVKGVDAQGKETNQLIFDRAK